MTNSIGFDCITYHNKKTPQGNFSYKTPEELEIKLNKYYYNYAMLVLRNKKGVAEGYSILFREMCKSIGIKCELVEGRASENKDKIKKLRKRNSFSTNHTWNKVQINGVWYYLDVTWASGYCDKPVKKFFKKLNFIKIADLVRNKAIEGVSNIRDESNKKGMRLVIELKGLQLVFVI